MVLEAATIAVEAVAEMMVDLSEVLDQGSSLRVVGGYLQQSVGEDSLAVACGLNTRCLLQ